jgi:hypothetical protein
LDKLLEHTPFHYTDAFNAERKEQENGYEAFGQELLRKQDRSPLPAEDPPVTPENSDPLTLPPQVGGLLPEEEVDELYREHRSAIESYYRKRKVLDIFNMRINNDIREAEDPVLGAYARHITTRIKMNASLGFVLRHKTSGDFRYFHSSVNNHAVFGRPYIVGNEEDLRTFLNDLFHIEFLDWIRQKRPNTS